MTGAKKTAWIDTQRSFSMKRKNLISMLGTAGLVLAFVFLAGCSSLGGGKKLGSLTITDIPAEYEGGTITPKLYSGIATNAHIANGSVTLSARGEVDASGAAGLPFVVSSEGQPSVGIYFEGLRFEGEAASVSWDAGVKTGVVTITGFPADTNGRMCNVFAGEDPKVSSMGPLIIAKEDDARGFDLVKKGVFSTPVFALEGKAFKPFTGSGVKKVVFTVQTQSNTGGGGSSGAVVDTAAAARAVGSIKMVIYSCDSVEFTDGSATLDFSQARN
jgi:hypothetical protein